MDNTSNEQEEPIATLRCLKLKNPNCILFGQINVNSIRSKFEAFTKIVKENLDVIVVTESKLDDSFPTKQFAIAGYNLPFRRDRNRNGGGFSCREIEKKHFSKQNLEGICLEIRLRKCKVLLFGGYNHKKANIDTFLGGIGLILDRNLSRYEHFLLLGDFNSELHELSMSNI